VKVITVLSKLNDVLKKTWCITTRTVCLRGSSGTAAVQNGGGVCILMYLSTHIIFLKHLVKVTTVLSKLNYLFKKPGI